MYEATFDPPILLNGVRLSELPATITTRREAIALFEMLPACAIQWCSVAACFGAALSVNGLALGGTPVCD